MLFILAHTLASAVATVIFALSYISPYAGYFADLNWPALMPSIRPFVLGLFVSTWLLALLPGWLLHKILHTTRFNTRSDYAVIGFTVGLLMSVPVIGHMSTTQLLGGIQPAFLTPGLKMILQQVIWVLAWALSGTAFGIAYWYVLSPNPRT